MHVCNRYCIIRKAKHELNGERIKRVLELLHFVQFQSLLNRSNRCLLSDPSCYSGRKFSHCNARLQNAQLKETYKLFHRKHGLVRFAVYTIQLPLNPRKVEHIMDYRWPVWPGFL